MLRTVSVNGVSIVVDPTGYEGYWSGVEAGRWEPETFDVIDRLVLRGFRMVDIGTWIGPLTLYAARKEARVHSYECDPVALRVLRTNIAANPDLARNIAIHEYALGSEDGFVTLYSRALGNSETSTLARHERDGAVIECSETVMTGVRDIAKVFRDNGYASDEQTFVKIDVEGAEFRLVDRLRPLLASSRCNWCVSVHELNINPRNLPVAPVRLSEVVRLLEAFSELNWFDMRMQSLDKAQVISALADGTWPIHQSFLFSRRASLAE